MNSEFKFVEHYMVLSPSQYCPYHYAASEILLARPFSLITPPLSRATSSVQKVRYCKRFSISEAAMMSETRD